MVLQTQTKTRYLNVDTLNHKPDQLWEGCWNDRFPIGFVHFVVFSKNWYSSYIINNKQIFIWNQYSAETWNLTGWLLDKYKRLDATLGNKRIGKLNMLWKSPNLRPIDMKEY